MILCFHRKRRSSCAIHANIQASSTGPGRCFPFWQEVLACYMVNTSSEDVSGQAKCVPVLEDYYECLHHKKEVTYLSRDLIPATNTDMLPL